MGKALLIAVAGCALFSGWALFGGQQANVDTQRAQRNYQDGLLAYQIARSAYNAAYADASAATSLAAGAALVHGRRGSFLGGRYEVRAEVEGSSLVIEGVGYFGGQPGDDDWPRATRRVGDRRLDGGILLADPAINAPRRLHARFLRSTAGYCSAVFLQQFLPDVDPDEQPAPEMIYESGHYRDGDTTSFRALIQPGTQVNFFVGVDQRCVREPDRLPGMSNAAWTAFLRNWRATTPFRAADYDYVHPALDIPIDDIAAARESPWAFLQQNAVGGERWRIAFEDIHNLAWLSGTTRQTSLSLTKRYGYDGSGWADAQNDAPGHGLGRNSADGYGDLRDYGDRPDFDDQVIEVWFTPVGAEPPALP